MARPRPEKKRDRKANAQLPLPTQRPPASSSATRVPSMHLQVGDGLVDEIGEWGVINRPHTTEGGKSAHARVRRVDQPVTVDEWTRIEEHP